MKRKIRDYLHLYAGCPCNVAQADDDAGGVDTYLDLETIQVYAEDPEETIITLYLRPLSSMTKEEATEIAGLIHTNIYGYTDLVLQEIVNPGSSDSYGAIFMDEHKEQCGLTIEADRGVEFSIAGQQMKVRQFDITAYLLQKGFDLFELIKDGLAKELIQEQENES